MPRRVNFVILLGITVVAVLAFGLSADAAPVEEGGTPGESIATGDDVVKGNVEENPALGGDIALGEGATPKDTNIAPEKGPTPEDTAPSEEGTGLKETSAPEGSAATEEDDTPAEDPMSEEGEIGDVGEASEAFDRMLAEAEEANSKHQNALSNQLQLESQVTETRNDLTAAEDSFEKAQDDLGKQASQMYKQARSGFVGMLLDAEDFTQFRDLLGLLIQRFKDGRDQVDEWRDSKNQLEQKKEELEGQLREWEQTSQEATDEQERAQTRADEARELFESQSKETQEAIEKERADETELALKHAERLVQEAANDEQPQEEPSGREEGADEAAGEAEPPQVSQGEIAQAVGEAIVEWPEIKRALRAGLGEGAKESDKTAVNEGAGGENPNPAAAEMADAAEKQKEAQDRARQAAEQTAKEQAAQQDAARLAEEAEKAKLAAQQASGAEQAEAQTAAEEAQNRAKQAAEQAAVEKKTTEETARQAAEKQTAATEAEQAALQKLTEQPATNGQPTASSGSGGGVLGEARTYMGTDYQLQGPCARGVAVDCSCFTMLVYKKFGLSLPDSPAAQWGMGKLVSGPPAAGDLVFFAEGGGKIPTHVGIAMGDGTMIHASSFADEVVVTPIKNVPGYLGAKRLL